MMLKADIFRVIHLSPKNVFDCGYRLLYCKGRALATRTGGREFESQPSHTKEFKNGNRYAQLSSKLEDDIDKPERWLSSRQMLCERLSCPKWEIKRTRTSYAGPSLVAIHREN